MSRSAVVGLITGIVLFAALGVVANMYKHGLTGRTWWVIAIAIGLGVYGAGLVAVCIRRIIDPKLDTPWLAAILALAWFIFEAFAKARTSNNDDDNSSSSNSSKTNSTTDDSMGLGWAIFSTFIGVLMYGASVTLLWAFVSHPAFARTESTTVTAKAAPKPAPAPPSTPAPAPAPAPPTAPNDIVDAKDLVAAIEFARPSFTDDRSAPSRGAKLLVRYAAAKLTWKDLAIAKNETSLELVEKDPAKATGKRLCVTGTLARIEKTTVDGTDAFSARMTTKTGDALEMLVVGDTGNLVKRKPAKFCGVVTGRLDVDGKPATFGVGMLAAP